MASRGDQPTQGAPSGAQAPPGPGAPPRDPTALAQAISALLANPERGRRLAAAAAERMHGYTIDAVAERFADLYERLLSEAAPKPDSPVAAQT